MKSRFHWRLFFAMAALLIVSTIVMAALGARALATAAGNDADAYARAQQLWWVGLVAVILAALAMSLPIAMRLARPLRELSQSAEQLADEGSGLRAVSRSRDEMDSLAASLSELRARLNLEAESSRRQHEQLNAVLSGMNEGVLAVDASERVLHMNRVALELLGVGGDAAPNSSGTAQDVVDKPLVEVTRDPHVVLAVSEALETGAEVNRAFVVRGISGAERKIELTASALYRDGGRSEGSVPTGAVLVIHDVTRVEKLEGVRRDFVSNVSHELKTPLTAIRGYVETMLETDDVDPKTQRRFLERIKVQTNRLSDLVGDLLSLSRIESPQVNESALPVDARTIVSETLQALRPESETRGTALEVALGDEALLVMADSEHLRQAFSNLVGNALKYSERGGKVEVRLLQHDEGVAFEVQDQGPGIATDQLDRIFERFYRVDKARSREVGGTGLGLAIVKNVATSVKGRVEVESELGQGSTFRMILPRA